MYDRIILITITNIFTEHKMKKLLSVIICFAVIFSALAVFSTSVSAIEIPLSDGWYSGNCGDDAYYYYASHNTSELFIFGEGEMYDYDFDYESEEYRPQSFGSARRVYIEDGVTSIGTCAFYYSSVESISIPDSVTSIGWAAFAQSCLSTISIPDTITEVASHVFDDIYDYHGDPFVFNEYDNALYLGNDNNPYLVLISAKNTNIETCIINENTRVIADEAFMNCKSLTGIEIPDSVVTVGKKAFSGCTAMTALVLSDSLTKIGDSSFSGCKNITDLALPDSLTTIEKSAFGGCSAIETVVLPDGLEELFGGAFANCTSLKSFEIPMSLPYCEKNVLYGCSSLESISAPERFYVNGNDLSSFSTINSATLSDDARTISNLPHNPEMYYEHDGANYLSSETDPYYALMSIVDNGISAFTINSETKYIAKDAFSSCSNLQYNIYDNAKYLGNGTNPYYALIAATSTDIVSCIIHEDTKIIASGAFNLCGQLETISIPASVEMITGDNTFWSCNSLQSIEVEGGNERYFSQSGILYYRANENEARFVWIPAAVSGDIIIPETVQSIADKAFYYKNITGVTMPDSIRSIGDYAFYACPMNQIVIPENVNYIGSYALWMPNLNEITFYNESLNSPSGVFSHVARINCYNNCYSDNRQMRIKRILSSADEVYVKGEYNYYFGESVSWSLELNSGRMDISTQGTTIRGYYGDLSMVPWKGYQSYISELHINTEIHTIEDNAFICCGSLTDVYYIGTEDEWDDIRIERGNTPLINATKHFHEHEFEENVIVEATCTLNGSIEYICSTCGKTYSETIPATGHTPTGERIYSAVTCTEAGEYYMLCSVCGEVCESGTVSPLGHLYPDEYTIVQQPTETTPGVKSRTCERCGKVEETSVFYCPGDANGDGKVNVQDLRLLKKSITGGASTDQYVMVNSDFNGDGKVNVQDLKVIKKMIAGVQS